MLRIILLIVISYIVIRIALRLLLTESPGQRRARMHGTQGAEGHPFFRSGSQGSGTSRSPGAGRFDHIEDAEFEEIEPRSGEDGKKGEK
jgi:hypothetical protein